MNAREISTMPATSTLGLRERKKLKTWRSIRREAFRLFAEQGYDATSVDQIAAAAEVSQSTFFRYFPTKEDVVLMDEYDSMLGDALGNRPVDEPIVDAVRHALSDSLARLLASDREELLFRTRLTFSVPSIRARSLEEQLQSQAAIAQLIAERTGRDGDDLEVKCVAAAIIAVLTTVIWHWVEHDGVGDLTALYDNQLALLSQGLHL
ncbi:TetR family transcriptional regulator [Streptomyces sp. WI04-05B]|uniref:acyl-CoA-like ligand-binding transcription factor n=1 Tax=Streptomyces TaxID=1883 RepID=UPI0029B9F243|nr:MULTISPECIES: TetR family transcriptional regulator [unclassified Streptomyces]MDX2548877.1 TetR family transcriptional regulator [Streptomyces sp. WI04-05B]MDX2590494.1 TetR family transcriptional regulator [Streptomyces sp. WI04-05A]MDX3751522.1 TetR family transcriptional regulator [Streptomyces sp. AK08-02]